MFGSLRRYTRKKTAKKARDAALEAVRDAEARHDDRALGKARMELQAATTALLKAETVRVVRR